MRENELTARMTVKDIAPEAYRALLGVERFLDGSTLPKSMQFLVKLRASQINGCSFCVDMHSRDAKEAGESDERLFAIAAWREAPYFTQAERDVLAYTEEATRLSDRGETVPDAIWDAVARHFDEQTMAALVVAVAMINAWNRIQVSTRVPAGSYRAPKPLQGAGVV
jgi:AhpD family alkylhydroperoxidase